MKKIIDHIKIWNRWRKYNDNSIFHKFLVLIGVIPSPTFYLARVKDANADELKTILDSNEVGATDDTVYVRTELTKDDIITDTDFDFKKWLEEEEKKNEN